MKKQYLVRCEKLEVRSRDKRFYCGIRHSAFRVLGLSFSNLLLLLLALQMGCSEGPVVRIGDVAQDFTLPSLTGEEVTLSQFKGKNVLSFFGPKDASFAKQKTLFMSTTFISGVRKKTL